MEHLSRLKSLCSSSGIFASACKSLFKWFADLTQFGILAVLLCCCLEQDLLFFYFGFIPLKGSGDHFQLKSMCIVSYLVFFSFFSRNLLEYPYSCFLRISPGSWTHFFLIYYFF